VNELKLKKIPVPEYFSIIKEQLSVGGQATVRVSGTSMKPFLQPERDTVELVRYEGQMKRGDLILYEICRGRYVLHRVTKPGQSAFTMRGDNAISSEKNLPCGKIIGIAAAVSHSGRIITRGSIRWRLYALLGTLNRFVKIVFRGFFMPVSALKKHILRNNRRV
jgi:hypothetical protein